MAIIRNKTNDQILVTNGTTIVAACSYKNGQASFWRPASQEGQVESIGRAEFEQAYAAAQAEAEADNQFAASLFASTPSKASKQA